MNTKRPCLHRLAALAAALIGPACLLHASGPTNLVGLLPGDVVVTNTGAATWAMPIRVSPGTSGMVPDLSLIYNSGAGPGQLGLGWSLGGLSTITRIPQSLGSDEAVKPISFTTDDRFALDGQRLILVSSGDYGDANTEYRTEIEQFARVKALGQVEDNPVKYGPLNFEVRTKAGLVFSYGTEFDEHGSNECRIVHPDTGAVLIWLVSRITDAAGNFISFRYEHALDGGSNRTGEFWLTEIAYTGWSDGSPGEDPYAAIEFEYETRPDPFHGYQAGVPLAQTRRLTTIRMMTAPADETTGAKSVYSHHYEISYTPSPANGRSLVSEIQFFAGGSESSPSHTLPPTVFSYGGAAPVFEKHGTITEGSWSDDDWHTVVDLAGNGKGGLVRVLAKANPQVVKYWSINTTSETALSVTSTPDFTLTTSGTTEQPVLFGDFDGDGRTDLLVFKPDTVIETCDWPIEEPGPAFIGRFEVRLYRSDGEIWRDNPDIPFDDQAPATPVKGVIVHPDFANISGQLSESWGIWDIRDTLVADFDGDGRDDLIVFVSTRRTPCSPAEQTRHLEAYLIKFNPDPEPEEPGSLSVTYLWSYDPSPYHPRHPTGDPWAAGTPNLPRFAAADLDGDGKAELIEGFRHTSDGKLEILITSHNGTTIPPFPYTGVDLGSFMTVTGNRENWILAITDLNGDGNQDLIVRHIYDVASNKFKVKYRPFLSTGINLDLSSGWIMGTEFVDTLQDHAGRQRADIYIDYNGDGLPDLVRFRAIHDATLGKDGVQLQRFIGTGSGFVSGGSTMDTGLEWDHKQPWRRTMLPGNLRGGSNPDFIVRANIHSTPTFQVWRLRTQATSADHRLPPDLLTSVTRAHPGFDPDPQGPPPAEALRTEITYAPLTEESVYAADVPWISEENDYPEPVAPEYPIRTLTAPMPVVMTLSKRVAPETDYHTEFAYGNGRIDLHGRGFLGFQYFFSVDVQTSVATAEFVEQRWPLTGRSVRSESRLKDGEDYLEFPLLSRVDQDWRWAWADGGGAFPFVARSTESTYGMELDEETYEPVGLESWFLVQKVTTANWFDGFADSEDNDHQGLHYADTYPLHDPSDTEVPVLITHGNLRRVQMDFRGEGGQLTESEYFDDESSGYEWIHNRWLIGRLSQTTVTTLDSGGSAVTNGSRTTSFTYNSDSGLLETETIHAPGRLELVTTHTRDGRGLITLTEATCPADDGQPDQTGFLNRVEDVKTLEVLAFDPRGRFATRVTNPVGDEETRTYDPRHGAMLSQTGPNGLTTAWTHDPLGSVLTEIRPKLPGDVSPEITSTRAWVTASEGGFLQTPPSGIGAVARIAAWSVTTTAPGTPTATTWYDINGLELRSEAESADGNDTIRTETFYDERGRAVGVTRPFFVGGTMGALTKTNYDIFDRVSRIDFPDGGAVIRRYGALYESDKYRPLEVELRLEDSQVKRRRMVMRDSMGRNEKVWEGAREPGTAPSIRHEYDPFGQIKKSILHNTTTTEFEYDDRGNKIEQIDPDMGTWKYEYNALGQLIWQEDATGNVTLMRYDALGRLLERRVEAPNSGPVTVSKFIYWTKDPLTPTNHGWVGALHEERSGPEGEDFPTFRRLHYYDGLGRPYITVTFADNQWFYSHARYDDHQRPAGVDHFWRPPNVTATRSPSWQSFGTTTTYNARGFPIQVIDHSGKVWWTADDSKVTADGQLLEHTTGDVGNLTVTRSFHATTGALDELIYERSSLIYKQKTTWNQLGHLEERTHEWGASGSFGTIATKTETLEYDNYSRLTTVEGFGVTFYSYAENGNLTARSGASLTYGTGQSGGPHALSSLDWTARNMEFEYEYDAAGRLVFRDEISPSEEDRSITVNWTAFGQPDVIGMGGAYSVFDYDASQQRIVHVSRASDESDEVKKKLTIGPFEIVSWAEPSQPNAHAGWRDWNWTAEEVRIFVTAPGGGLIGIVGNDIWPESDPGPRYRQAFITDHLGSVVGVVNSGGTLTQRFSYDPWGHARNPSTGDLLDTMPARRGDRGFTGHEELRHLGLVHMNGRVYDPMATRFLSPDPFIQFPEFDQSWNRYSYVLNNPLTFTDPSGYFIPVIIGILLTAAKVGIIETIVVMAITSFIQTLAMGGTLSQALTAAVIAGASAYVAWQIGNVFSGWADSAKGFAEKGMEKVCRAAAHGVSQGAFTAAGGGKFQDGFTGAFVSKLGLSLAFESAAMQKAMGSPGSGEGMIPRTITAALIGGTASKLGGGKFASGAASAAVSWMFNSEGVLDGRKGKHLVIEFDPDREQGLPSGAQTAESWGGALEILGSFPDGSLDSVTLSGHGGSGYFYPKNDEDVDLTDRLVRDVRMGNTISAEQKDAAAVLVAIDRVLKLNGDFVLNACEAGSGRAGGRLREELRFYLNRERGGGPLFTPNRGIVMPMQFSYWKSGRIYQLRSVGANGGGSLLRHAIFGKLVYEYN